MTCVWCQKFANLGNALKFAVLNAANWHIEISGNHDLIFKGLILRWDPEYRRRHSLSRMISPASSAEFGKTGTDPAGGGVALDTGSATAMTRSVASVCPVASLDHGSVGPDVRLRFMFGPRTSDPFQGRHAARRAPETRRGVGSLQEKG